MGKTGAHHGRSKPGEAVAPTFGGPIKMAASPSPAALSFIFIGLDHLNSFVHVLLTSRAGSKFFSQ